MVCLHQEQEQSQRDQTQLRCIWHKNCTLAFNHVYVDNTSTFGCNEREQELIDLHHEINQAILSGDPRHPSLLRLLAPGFQAQHDRHSTTELMDISELMSLVCDLQGTLFRHVKLETGKAWVDFENAPGSRNGSIATVWMVARINMYKEGVARDSLLLSRWRRAEDNPETKWLCYYTGALSSAPMVSGQMGRCF